MRRPLRLRTVLLGGEAALAAAVADGAPNARRVSGSERAATAAAIATELWGIDAPAPRALIVLNGFVPEGWAYGSPSGGSPRMPAPRW